MTTGPKIYDREHVLLNVAEGRRFRMQGLSDACMHYGWIDTHRQGVITLELKSKNGIRNGDLQFVEISTPAALLTLVAIVIELGENYIKVQVTSDIEERPLKSESRLKVIPFKGQLVVDQVRMDIRVLDVSDQGFGFETVDELLKKGAYPAVLYTQQGDIKVDVDVKHLRTDRESGERHGGVQIKEIDRISKARWTRLFVE